jgi:hypothetical protein
MGLFLLLVIRFLPDGLGSLLKWPAALRRDPPAAAIAGTKVLP